jgi:3'-5' exoribonuclease
MTPITKKIYVADIAAGDHIDDLFVLADKTLSHKRDGNAYLTLTLADKSGRIKGVVWDNVERIAETANAGDYVRVNGSVSEYRGKMQMVVKSMLVQPADTVSAADFLPATTRDVDQMFERLQSLCDTMETPSMKALMEAFWEDEAFVRQFKQAPAAKKMHHAYLGGLLQHTLSMALLADKISSHYGGLNRDLLLAGAVLHDIGKVRELSYEQNIDYTDEGRLLSHIVIGLEMVDEKIRSIPEFPRTDAAMIKHLIVSHHGAREFGSPEPPKTIEAVLLNYIDEIDSRVNGIREFMAAEDPDAAWTGYHRLLERHFYKGEPKPS